MTDIWFKRVIRDQNKYFDTNYRHFLHWKILSCHDLGYQMSIFKKKLYIKLKPLISSLLWNLHHEHISFRSKVIPIKVLKNTCPGFKPSCDRRSQNITTGLFGLLHDLLTFIVQLHDVISWRKREYVCLITNKNLLTHFFHTESSRRRRRTDNTNECIGIEIPYLFSPLDLWWYSQRGSARGEQSLFS